VAVEHIVDRFFRVYYPHWPEHDHDETGTWIVSQDIADRLDAHARKYGWPFTGGHFPMFGRPVLVTPEAPPDTVAYEVQGQ